MRRTCLISLSTLSTVGTFFPV